TRFDADLDMRMDRSQELTAEKIINSYSEDDLHRIFGIYGEIKNAKTLAKSIVSARLNSSIKTSAELKEAIIHLIPKKKENKYLAQVFQALRIEENQELEALQEFLMQAAAIINVGD